MNKPDCTIQSLMNHDYPVFIHRGSEGYSACIPSLGILASANTLDECYAKVEESKTTLLEAIVERGFGDSMLSVRAPSSNPQPWVRMMFALAVLTLLLLTILIPANYLLSELSRRVPTYAEAVMDVVQRRVQQMSDDDKRKLSGLVTRMCPVLDEMVEARCRSVTSHASPASGAKLR